MSQTPPPVQKVVAVSPQPVQRDVPVWIFAVVILLCVAGGGAFTWWFFASKPAPVAAVKLKEEAAQPAGAPGTAAPANPTNPPGPSAPANPPERPRRQPRNRNQFPSLPQGELPPGTRVTRKWEAAPIEQVIRELPLPGKMTVSLVGGAGGERKITLDAADQPLFGVIQQLCAQGNLLISTEHGGDRGRITLGPASSDKQPPTAVHGPYYLSLRSLSHSASARLGGEAKIDHHVQLTFVAGAEPGTPLYGIVGQATIEEAVDQAGKSLINDNVRYSSEPNRLESRWWTHAHANIGFADGSARVARLRGYVTVLTYDKLESFEIEDPLNARGKATTVDGIRVRFKQLRESGSEYEAQFEADGSYNDPAIRYRFSPNDETMKLLDANGKPFDSQGGGWGGGDPYPFRRSFSKKSGRSPAKLVLLIPTGLKELRLPFDFTDIPLPN